MAQKKFNLMAVISNLRAGGAERMFIELLLRLKESFNVSVACIRDKGELAPLLEDKSIKVHISYFKGRLDPKSLFNLASLLKRENIHIVHTHMYRPNISGAIGAFIARVPVIVSHVHTVHQWDTKRQIFMDKITTGMKDKIIALSEEVKKAYTEKVNANPEKVRVIYNGVDSQIYRADKSQSELRENFNIKNRSPVIGIIGRLAPEKDHITFLEAADIVSKACPEACFLIVGKGPEEENIRSCVERLNLADKVIVAGYRKDIPEVLNILDIFVISSVREGFSLAILEAMAAGKPVIATDVGGNREAVIDGETGFIVPQKKPLLMASKILNLISNPELRAMMGEKGYQRVVKKFSIGNMLTETSELYSEILDKKGIKKDS